MVSFIVFYGLRKDILKLKNDRFNTKFKNLQNKKAKERILTCFFKKKKKKKKKNRKAKIKLFQ